MVEGNANTIQVETVNTNANSRFEGLTQTPQTGATEAQAKEEIKALDFAKKFGQLSKKEALLRQREQELSSKYKPMEEELLTYRELKTLKENAKQNPIAVLRALGLSYDDVTNFQLKGGESNPEVSYKMLEKKLEDSKTELEQRMLNQKQQENQEARARALDKFKREIDTFVKEHESEYEMIQYKGAVDVVYQTIEAEYNKTGRELTFKEACDLVEKYFEDEELDKMSKLNKLKSRVMPTESTQGYRPTNVSPRLSTLSNNSVGSELRGTSDNLTREERMTLAAKMIQRR